VLGEYLACHEVLLARRDLLDGLIAEQAAVGPWSPAVGRLRCLRGVDTLTAVGLIADPRSATSPRLRDRGCWLASWASFPASSPAGVGGASLGDRALAALVAGARPARSISDSGPGATNAPP
jgi:hypothetical protein